MPRTIHLLVVDALNLVRRVYAAQPGPDGPERVDSALRSSVQSLERALRETRPTHAVCVFEGAGESWRHAAHPGYKQSHAPMPEELGEALPEFVGAFLDIGAPSFELPETEADDVIGTLATKVAESDGNVTILSTDKIFLQLLSPRIRVRDHFAKKDLDAAHVRDKFGVEPERLVDFLALTGDSTNDIPGVHGVGPKTAARLLADHPGLDAVLDAADSIEGKLGERLGEHADAARLSRSLVRLRVDLDLGLNLRTLRYAAASRSAECPAPGRTASFRGSSSSGPG